MVKFHPSPGQILRCDFRGFAAPEMTKIRPVIVISPRPERASKRTCIIAPLSTTAPKKVMPFHMLVTMPQNAPDNLASECWLKGDMIYSVSLARLSLYWTHKQGGRRIWWRDTVGKENLADIRQCVSTAIGRPT